MSYRNNAIRNLRTIKAYRGEALKIDLGQNFDGILTAWMKRDPNDLEYRLFEVQDGRYLYLSKDKASDYVVGSEVVSAIEGKWYFDVEQDLDDGITDVKTIYRGTIMFQNDITNSGGMEGVPPPNNQYRTIDIVTYVEADESPSGTATNQHEVNVEVTDELAALRELVEGVPSGSIQVWDENETYDPADNDYVSFVNPGSTDPQFQTEAIYRCVTPTTAEQSPETHPAKWLYQGENLTVSYDGNINVWLFNTADSPSAPTLGYFKNADEEILNPVPKLRMSATRTTGGSIENLMLGLGVGSKVNATCLRDPAIYFDYTVGAISSDGTTIDIEWSNVVKVGTPLFNDKFLFTFLQAQGGPGGGDGDMTKVVYDPTNVNGDAFSMGNMAETASAKVFAGTERTKLGNIEDGAEVNQTDAEIKTQYEANADTNAFTDTEQTKLANIEAGAEVNNLTDVQASNLTSGANSTDHFHDADRDRANHTGTQTASTISDFASTLAGTTNTAPFTPTADNHVATKKYVDDNAGGASTWEDLTDVATKVGNAKKIPKVNDAANTIEYTAYDHDQVVNTSDIDISDPTWQESEARLLEVKKVGGEAVFEGATQLIDIFAPPAVDASLSNQNSWSNEEKTLTGENFRGELGKIGQLRILTDGTICRCTGSTQGTDGGSDGSATYKRNRAIDTLDPANNTQDSDVCDLLDPSRTGGTTDDGWDLVTNMKVISTVPARVGTWWKVAGGYAYYCYEVAGSSYYWFRIGAPAAIYRQITTTSHPTLTTNLLAHVFVTSVYTIQGGDELSYQDQTFYDLATRAYYVQISATQWEKIR